MKTIGVLGGMGPQATMEFEQRVHAIAQRLIPQRANSGYPPMLVHYHRMQPFVATDSGTPQMPPQLHPAFIDSAVKVAAHADFIVITSNFPHLFRAEIERATEREVLSMIDVTLAEVNRRQWRRVGVLGMGDPLVYTEPLGRLGLDIETIGGELRTLLNAAILAVMEGRDEDVGFVAYEAIDVLRARNVDGIILGCTEIPLLLRDAASAPDLINPLQYLAEAAVVRAIS